VGHRLPGGTNDSNQLWLEARAFDGHGRIVGATGVPDRDGRLPADAHVVRAQPVDGEGAPLARRDVQHMRGVVFDTALGPSDPQVVRLALPAGAARVEARLLYRKFSADYASAACALVHDAAARGRCLDVPVITVATADSGTAAGAGHDWRRLVDHGLGLADAPADRADEARAPLEAARALAPDRPEPLLGLARLALRLGRTDEVLAVADEALRVAPEHPAALYLRTHALLRAYRLHAARAEAERLLRRLPGDRQALLLAARARGLDGDAAGALAAADAALAIDPESEEAHLQRGLALGELGRAAEAAEAEARYLRHRVAAETDLELRRRFRAGRPEAADEPEPVHTHELRLARPRHSR